VGLTIKSKINGLYPVGMNRMSRVYSVCQGIYVGKGWRNYWEPGNSGLGQLAWNIMHASLIFKHMDIFHILTIRQYLEILLIRVWWAFSTLV